MRSIVKKRFGSDLDPVTVVVVTDGYTQYWTDLRVFPRNHPFALDNWSSRGNVHSRHEPPNFASS